MSFATSTPGNGTWYSIDKRTINSRSDYLIMNNIVTSLRAAFVVENILGIFRFRSTKQCLDSSTGTMKIFGIILVAICSSIYFFSSTMTSESKAPTLIQIFDSIPGVVVLCQYGASVVITSFLLGKESVQIIVHFTKLDSKLGILLQSEFYKSTTIQNSFYIVISVSVNTTFCILDYCLSSISVLVIMVDYVTYLAQMIEIIVFCLMILMLKGRLHVINCHLIDLRQKYRGSGDSLFRSNQGALCNPKNCKMLQTMSLSNLSFAYDMIGELCRLINNVFNYQMFLTLISTFLYLTITIWSTISYLRVNSFSWPLITRTMWCAFALGTVAFMAFVCEAMLWTRNETKVLVNELVMDYGLPADARAQAKAFMQLIDAWPLRIHVYDMVSIDISLMLKFISVSTTYLIIILQISRFV